MIYSPNSLFYCPDAWAIFLINGLGRPEKACTFWWLFIPESPPFGPCEIFFFGWEILPICHWSESHLSKDFGFPGKNMPFFRVKEKKPVWLRVKRFLERLWTYLICFQLFHLLKNIHIKAHSTVWEGNPGCFTQRCLSNPPREGYTCPHALRQISIHHFSIW